jgi:hypothetical protein
MPFAVLILCVGVCELVLASAVMQVAAQCHRAQGATYLIAVSAIWSFGIAIFADPEPLHSVFGYVGLVAMLSPLVFAWTWRREPKARRIAVGSWVLGIIVWAGIISFAALMPSSGELQAYAGVFQRVFLYCWMGWLALVGILLRSIATPA